MWISRKHYEDLMTREAESRGAAQVLERQVAGMSATFDWMRVRLSQVERERAQLMYNYMGIKIETPEIQPAPASPPQHPLNATESFEDVGDERAAALGIGWNADGTLRYDSPKTEA